MSGLVGIAAIFIGARWVHAGGDPVAIPATLIVLSLLVLTPLAMQRSWVSRGEFIDHHMEAACRFLTSIGLAAVAIIGLPAAISQLLPASTELWASVMVLPYLGALALPVTWAFFALRAAVLASKGASSPFPDWMIAETGNRSGC